MSWAPHICTILDTKEMTEKWTKVFETLLLNLKSYIMISWELLDIIELKESN